MSRPLPREELCNTVWKPDKVNCTTKSFMPLWKKYFLRVFSHLSCFVRFNLILVCSPPPRCGTFGQVWNQQSQSVEDQFIRTQTLWRRWSLSSSQWPLVRLVCGMNYAEHKWSSSCINCLAPKVMHFVTLCLTFGPLISVGCSIFRRRATPWDETFHLNEFPNLSNWTTFELYSVQWIS